MVPHDYTDVGDPEKNQLREEVKHNKHHINKLNIHIDNLEAENKKNVVLYENLRQDYATLHEAGQQLLRNYNALKIDYKNKCQDLDQLSADYKDKCRELKQEQRAKSGQI